jgi:hypothetical protein
MWMLVIAVLVAGCAPSTDIIQHGNKKLQLTQTYNQWADNIVAVTECDKLYNGYCPDSAPTQIVVMSGKLPGVVGAGLTSAAMLGSAAIINDGLKGSKSKINQNNTNRNDVRASTVNPR